MIEVEHLSKYYGTFHALRDVTFNVERGEILGFLGPNGAGKTTTMRIITGYIPATAGTVRVAGFDVAEKSLDARKHLGYLPETVPLYTELTPSEYLDFKGRITGMHNGRDRKARINEVMDQLNLHDVARKPIGALSRGFRQRVGLAQALLHNPDVLILDEPTVGLDPVQITEVRDLIRELGRDRTIILSTHLLPEVSMVCNRVIIINRGRLVALDTPIHLAQDVGSTSMVQVEVRGAVNDVLAALRSVPVVTSARQVVQQADGASGDGASDAAAPAMPGTSTLYEVQGSSKTDLRPQVASAVVGAGLELLELRSVRPTLEQVFIDIITRDAATAEQDELEDEMLDEDEDAEIIEDERYEDGQEEPARGRRSATATGERTQISAKRRVRR